ncbi:EMBRYO DEFECTIVE 3136 [Hibiscus trionum]|uniref:EMBRYO DEFECTIVE 3136 n=1 Tax=Hibiscus trionum TaxID=183268 RepID=A0A9W7GQ48_HIBTR|nr:EMBRYO DEFECTIVE 3136 [Hibiscus trionum]
MLLNLTGPSRKKMKVEDDFTGVIFEGIFYGPDEFKQLENMLTKAVIYAKLLGSLRSLAIGHVGTLQAPARDVVMLLMAYVKKLEEESGGN